MFTPEQLNIVKFCAEECARQGSGEESVSWMVNAWEFASFFQKIVNLAPKYNQINLNFISELGKITEPKKNELGFRTYAVGIHTGFGQILAIGSHWENIPKNLQHLVDAYYAGRLDPAIDGEFTVSHELAKSAEDQFYYDYETIHPFGDGNGRTGKILYNYLKGTLDNPVMPPNFFGSSNP